MKRSGPLQRTTELERGAPLKRTGWRPLTRDQQALRSDPLPKASKRLRRRPKREKPAAEWELERVAREAWHLAVVSRGSCLMCRAFPVSDEIRAAHGPDLNVREGHHVIAKRHLKAHGLTGRLWDSDNGMGLCRYHHARHEKAIQRIPLALLPTRAVRFAREVGLDWILDREYAQ